MRGADVLQESLFSVRKLDDFVPATHPLRPIRERVNQALLRLDGLFARMYADDAKAYNLHIGRTLGAPHASDACVSTKRRA